jgi:hypothetical protein
MNHFGGIIYDQRHSDRVEIREIEMSQQLKRYYQNCIDELEKKLIKSDNECFNLRAKLNKLQNLDPESDPDDVLVRRICTLCHELEKEREAHKKEVEDLNYRLDVAMEVNAELRHRTDDTDKKSQEIAERHVDILASIMALFPFTPTEDLSFEFGLQPNKISYVAQALGVLKSKDERDAARSYLQKQGLQLMERRGGLQSEHFMKQIEKVARNGRVVATYKSINEAAEMNGIAAQTITKHCTGKIKGYTIDGYKYRYKKTKEKI